MKTAEDSLAILLPGGIEDLGQVSYAHTPNNKKYHYTATAQIFKYKGIEGAGLYIVDRNKEKNFGLLLVTSQYGEYESLTQHMDSMFPCNAMSDRRHQYRYRFKYNPLYKFIKKEIGSGRNLYFHCLDIDPDKAKEIDQDMIKLAMDIIDSYGTN